MRLSESENVSEGSDCVFLAVLCVLLHVLEQLAIVVAWYLRVLVINCIIDSIGVISFL